MKQRILNGLKQGAIYVAIFLVISAGVDWWRGKDIPKVQLPELQGVSVQGVSVQRKPLNLKALSEDQAVLVYFWGSWCGVCNFVSPSVDTMSDYFPVITVALSCLLYTSPSPRDRG